MNTDRIARNIPLDYCFSFISNFNLLHALWMIYLHMRGFSLFELGILEGTFHITSFLMEVPTGAVADLRGRRQSRVLGRVFALFSLLFLRFSSSLALQMCGFALGAVSYNLESGAGEALVYDSLKFTGREGAYKRVAGKRELLYQGAMASAVPLGGFIAFRTGYDMVFLLMAVVILLSLFNALLFSEAPCGRTRNHEDGLLLKKIARSLAHQCSESLKVIKGNPRIALLIVFTESVFAFATTFYYYIQTYWKTEGMSESRMGLIFAAQCIFSGLCGLASHRAEKRFGETGLLTALPLIQLICLWGIALSPWKSPFFILTGLSEGILFIAVSDYINRDIPSALRATILSFQSMVFSLLMIFLFPLLGWIGDRWSLQLGFLLSASAALGLYGLFLFYSMPIIKKQQVADIS